MRTETYDLAVIGGGLGAVQAARAACEQGKRVLLCEATDWIGGQMTSQAVPPDEHRWIREQGAPKSYLAYRRAVQEAYLRMPEASDLMRETDDLNPGNGWVSLLCHDPRIGLAILRASLRPYEDCGRLKVMLTTRCVEAETAGNRVLSVTLEKKGGERIRVQAAFFLDGTDTGELLPLTGTEYCVGAESRDVFQEPHAPTTGDREDQQPITWVAALKWDAQRQPMEKPAGYETYARASFRGEPLLGWKSWGSRGLMRFSMLGDDPEDSTPGLWSYRRIQYPPYFSDGRSEVVLLNWPQNDYVFGNIIDTQKAEENCEQARELTRCCAYWLWEQGYPVSFCPDMLGTEDGLAKAPYVRESRRIVSLRQIREQEIARAYAKEPPTFHDSIGVGHYSLDLHMTTRTHFTLFEEAWPFEIPLGAMIPVRMENLLPAAKNIGATHLTGGCFRLHPVEWTIGEAAGMLASFCLDRGIRPRDVEGAYLTDFQRMLTANGAQLHWKMHDTNM